jgi:YVTN family beta-propeller protein
MRQFLAMCLLMALVSGVAASDYLSPIDLVASKDGKQLYVACETANSIVVLDVPSGKVRKSISVPGPVSGLVLSPTSPVLLVTCGVSDGQLLLIDVAKGKVSASIRVGHSPNAPAVSPDGKTAYVCNRFNDNVSVVDLAARKEVSRIAVEREPVACALTKDGKFLFVAGHIPSGAANGEFMASKVSVIDTAAGKVEKALVLPNGSMNLRGMCISPDGKHVYVTHIVGRFQVPTTQLERGWMNTNAMSIIDANTRTMVNTVLLDDVDLGAANPWGVTCTADGKYLCVSLSGTREVAVINRQAMHEKLVKVAAGEGVSQVSLTAKDVPNDLSFLVGMKRRLKITGIGPRGITTIGSKAYTADHFSDGIGVLDVAEDVNPSSAELPLGPKKEMDAVRRGEMFFNDATLCFQLWQSCASCHPDARTDGLNWDLLNDGMGNPKQDKSLLFAHMTPPVMISGIRDKAETAVRAGIKYIQFAVRPDEDAQAIDEYLKSLRPIPSPYLVAGKLSKLAKKGKKVFKKARCADCHVGKYLTDMQKYDIGTGAGIDEGKEYDVPTLIEMWRTAPYLSDGRAITMRDVITTHNKGDKHGVTSKLSEAEIVALIEYVLSL